MLLEEEKMIKIAKQKLGLSITNDFSDGADVYCYQESTADGYEVWVLTHDYRDVNVSENVYYYDHDIADELFEMIMQCGADCTLNIDEDTWNDLYMDDQMLEYFGETIDDIIEDNDEEGFGLTQAEIQDLTKEYGLDADEIEETVS